MDLETYYEYCLSKKGATEHFPFDQDILVFKVGGKIFALSSLKQWELGNPSVNLKCNPDLAKEWRLEFEAIQPGFHMNKNHWNTVLLNTNISSAFLKKMIDLSYDLVFNSLTKKAQQEVADL